MNEFVESSATFGVVITLIAYEAGTYLRKKTGKAWCNPLLLAVILVILCLLVCDIDYSSYQNSAKYISYLLTPATVCLAISLYQKVLLLKENFAAILGGIFAGTITSLTVTLAMTIVFGMTYQEYVTLLPKSITTAVGIGITEELGGFTTITVAVIVMTGIVGNITAEWVCNKFKIKNPIAKGVAIGCASHAIGTTKAMEMGEIEGAMSSLAIVVSAICTVVLAPLYANLYTIFL